MAKQPAGPIAAKPDQTLLVAAPGRTVLTEEGKPWPADGMDDPGTLYTRRRLADGDLITAQQTTPDAEGDK